MTLSRRARITAFLSPYLLGTLILIVIPAGLSFYIAFMHYNGVARPVFAGWQNFQFLPTEPFFKLAITNSLIFTAWAVPLRVLGALILALFYNHPHRGTGLYRAAVYLPTIIPDAAYALTWTWILNPLYGPLNASLRTLGLPTPLWLADSAWAFPAIILVSLLQIGEGFVILLAGLRHMPQVLYDSARVDGANRWQMFSSITLPLLVPWLVLLTVRDVVLSFQSTFTPAYIMTRGGPYYSTFFTPLFIYETAFDRLLFGPAAAVTLVVFIFTVLIVLIVYQFFDKWALDEE
ncbi:MAG: sugar ABC transporter permease [Chloroflexi bacterium]|nr:sugar ABC transporter permease [Chloroflexota bacterium]